MSVRVAAAPYLLAALALAAAPRPNPRLKSSSLEAVHEQRIEWMRRRAPIAALGVYRDFRSVLLKTAPSVSQSDLVKAATQAGVLAIFSPVHFRGFSGGVLFSGPLENGFHGMEIYRRDESDPAQWRSLRGSLKKYPDETLGALTDRDPSLLAAWDRESAAQPATGFAWSDPPPGVSYETALENTSTHILARKLSEEDLRSSLIHGHAYVAHDWLCDSSGFFFIAEDNLGVFDMGDTVGTGPAAGQIRLQAYVPVPAKLKLIRDGAIVAETSGSQLSYAVKEQGVYRLEAWLKAGGEERPWILSNPIYIQGTAEIRLPPEGPAPGVNVERDVMYAAGSAHKLDLYLPQGRTHFPALLFVPGEAWRTANRSLASALGNRLAQAGIAVAVPGYRLMPDHPHPAQIEDVAAAFAWIYRNIARYGGDASRIYVGGHSAGGHLISLLALDREWLAKLEIPITAIRGAVSISGIYDLRNATVFLDAGDRNEASPAKYVDSHAPPFLVAYCQWDYLGFPKQARDFDADLRKSFVSAQLVYVPGENHVSEIPGMAQDANPLTAAILSFIK
ncbi:MAG TPA: alpha/beta fold hydrolase [Bryobacteraceae bacterium]|nr:alpha/beta fold hydrolase [Bryobacteraceae bacterium]